MNGTDFLNEISKRISKERGTKTLTDAVLAREIGVSQANLAQWRGKELTPRQMVNVMEKIRERSAKIAVEGAIQPIVEFFNIDRVENKQSAAWLIFSTRKTEELTEHPYLAGLKQQLETSHGLYIFHDSRGRAIYAGKAQRQDLWKEINLAFNRDRGEVQNIRRVAHPTNRVNFTKTKDSRRSITKESVALHEIASYVSAYRIDESMIGTLEALIIRAFANDLLNIKMENFAAS